jgi:hypothetical protein
MEEFKQRKFKFKAWNQEAKLLMKVSSIECYRGELMKKNHILLQFTGLYDKHDEEIYEMDILLISNVKYVVRWSEQNNGWYLLPYPKQDSHQPLAKELAATMKRLCNFFEAEPQ